MIRNERDQGTYIPASARAVSVIKVRKQTPKMSCLMNDHEHSQAPREKPERENLFRSAVGEKGRERTKEEDLVSGFICRVISRRFGT